MEKDHHWSINKSKFIKFNTISEEWYENISYTSGRNEETNNDFPKTKETLHVVESMEKVERFWHMRNIYINNEIYYSYFQC